MRSASARVRSASACSSPDDFLPAVAHLLFGVRDERVGFLARFQLGFLFQRFGVALRLGAELAGVFLGAPDGVGGDAFAAGDPEENGGNRDDRCDGRRRDEVHG